MTFLLARVPVISRSICYSKEHRAEIGDQPNKPDKYAELVEIADGIFVLLEQDHQRPHGMDEHEQYCDEPGYAMDIKSHTAYILKHHAGPDCVADEAENKEGKIPPFESAGEAFAPYTDGIKDQC